MRSLDALPALAALVAAGLVAERAARWLRIPDIVLWLAGGVLLGPVLHVVRLSAGGPLAGTLLAFGASFMLFEGGRRLSPAVLREIWLGLTLLSTVGVVLTAGVVAVGARLILRLPWAEDGLFGAVVSATDPATLIPLFRAVSVRARLARLMEAESACNDAVAATLTAVMAAAALHGRLSPWASAAHLCWMVGGAVGVGLAVGLLASALLPGGRGWGLFDTQQQAAMLSLTVVLGAFVAATALGCSGYLSVFTAGVVMGRRALAPPTPRPAHRRLHEAYLGQVGVLVRMTIFLVLGAAIDLALVVRLLVPSVLLAAVLIVVARPVCVLACLPADRVARWSRGEVAFAAWVRETGVVPAALAGILRQQGVPFADTLAAAVFVAILATILIQPTTSHWWARQCGVALGRDGAGGPA